jgi:hypothetical protein
MRNQSVVPKGKLPFAANKVNNTMIYRFAFRTTDDGYLRVTALSQAAQDFTAIHLDQNVFAASVKGAGISEPKSVELVAAANEAYRNMGVAVCCERVELTKSQVRALGLFHSARRVAVNRPLTA